LTATLSPEEKKKIEQKPTENLKAYEHYLRAKVEIGNVKLNYTFGSFAKKIRDAVDILEQAMEELAFTLHDIREFSAAEQVYDRLIGLVTDQPMLKVQKASVVSLMQTGDDSVLRAAIEALPEPLATDRAVLSLRLGLALADHDGQEARRLIERMKCLLPFRSYGLSGSRLLVH